MGFRSTALRALVCIGAAAVLTACASDDDGGGRRGPGGPRGGAEGGGPGGPGGPGGGPGAANIFISPSGQVFRAPRGAPYPSATWFAAADTDHDGHLTRAEFIADAEAYFRQLDTDHNGVIDGFEIVAYEKATPELAPDIGRLQPGEGMNNNLGGGGRRGRGGGGFGGGGGGGGGGRAGPAQRSGAALYGLFDDPEPVSAADADLSGTVTLAEFRKQAEQHFDVLDKTHAGFLTFDGLPKTGAQRRADGPRRGGQGGGQGGGGQRQRPAG